MREAANMPRRLPAGCVEDRDRHGNIRIYYRVKGRPKVRLRGTPWAPEFMAAYDDAMGGARKSAKSGIRSERRHGLRWRCCVSPVRGDPTSFGSANNMRRAAS